MKTSTLLKRVFRVAGFLTILLVLFSFKNEKPTSNSSIEVSSEQAINAEKWDSLVVPIKNFSLKLEQKDTHILLTIDTKTINNANVDKKVRFSDDRSDTIQNPGNPATFTSLVDKNMKVIWSGVPKDPESSVIIEILDIERKRDGGSKLLRFGTKTQNNKGVQIKVKDRKIEGLEYYLVKFSITEGDEVRVFEVDPKLEMGG